ncbi:044R [Cherax quadricarinatus iridovirus]|uniref:Uncharacterized protein n=1 Tax=Shrimp hemocyte iridescent virus TaxID=2039780 RepID=A0A291B0U7_9VIRU|nr:044R [Cherax quadricarinatus iridovirus]YP_010084860.1 hypothetical protein KM509_gp108 [Shrimp hemocyte iridescent virus]UPA43362.1 hypothetical protein 4TH000088 [Iridovirus CN01]ASZ85024.1 044R [Cherax quadricarinatus iridovirus]ATE87117.1 hypothetical protein [Shrimp hemocyte iridescent virus]UPA43438.1 hypothetical protein 3TG000005 [Iridovirus CN01]
MYIYEKIETENFKITRKMRVSNTEINMAFIGICGVFDEATIAKLEIFGIQAPKKTNLEGIECYNISFDDIVEAEDVLDDQFVNYVKIVIFSHLFKIGKSVMMGEDGHLVPYETVHHEEDFENILEENKIFDEFTSDELCHIADGIDYSLETMCDLNLITADQFEEYSRLINVHIIYPKQNQEFEEEEEDDIESDSDVDSDYFSDFDSDEEV